MSMPVAEQSIYMQLRSEAEARLQTGTAAAYSKWSLGVDALRLLHRLSSDPETAADALKLLHELQVHQVELDLQNEEMQLNEQHRAGEFSRYKALYEFAPVAYFLVDFQGAIVESNLAGIELLGAGKEALTGERIDRFMAAESRTNLLNLLKRVAQEGGAQTCQVTVNGEKNAPRAWRVVAGASPDKLCALLAFSECT